MEIETINYRNAVQSALSSTIQDYKLSAIDTFIVNEKAAGRWEMHRNLWLPVWGNMRANLVCLVNGYIIGRYPNGATHGIDYVKGNSSNQYFDSLVSASTVLSSNSTHIFSLVLDNPAHGTFYGVGQNALNLDISENTGLIYQLSGYNGNAYSGDKSENTGLIYQLSGYNGNTYNPNKSENTGFIYSLSGYFKDPFVVPSSDNTGLVWILSGALI